MNTVTPISERIARTIRKMRDRGIQLGSPLSNEAILCFEQRHSISLPESFRAFLLHVGNGGAGPPAYGLAALGESARDMRSEEANFWLELPEVCQPFPFTKVWVWEEGDVSEEGTMQQARHGCIYLGNDGCGMYWFLIITGPERGNVWMICDEGMQPTEPKRDFLQWYEDWLDGTVDWWK